PFTERVTGYLQFEAFNVFNTPYDTGRRTDEYSLTSGSTLSFIGSYGTGNSTATSPDGTNARRAQLALRVVFYSECCRVPRTSKLEAQEAGPGSSGFFVFVPSPRPAAA